MYIHRFSNFITFSYKNNIKTTILKNTLILKLNLKSQLTTLKNVITFRNAEQLLQNNSMLDCLPGQHALPILPNIGLKSTKLRSRGPTFLFSSNCTNTITLYNILFTRLKTLYLYKKYQGLDQKLYGISRSASTRGFSGWGCAARTLYNSGLSLY